MSFINIIEDKINSYLRKYPKIKKVIKRIYQFSLYLILPKVKKEGNITRITPNDEYEYYFGYYDKSPWNNTEDYMICIRAKCTYKDVSPKEDAEIVLIDLKNNNKVEIIGKTSTWNVQQGCMLQWLGPNFDNTIIYNDCIDNKYVSIIYNIKTKSKKIINMPIYSISNDGKVALSLDFSRLYNLRPGYGYYNLKEETENVKCPDKPCIYKIDLEKNEIIPILRYTDLLNIDYRDEFKNAVHKVNHIMISPNGKRFMVLHRWFNGDKKSTRLLTMNLDGTDIYNLLDEDMVSHCCWKNDEEILTYAHTNKDGNKYYLLKDKTQERKFYWENELMFDGHPTFSPNGKYIITDRYPDRQRLAHVYLMNTENDNVKELAKVFAPFRYDNDTRCDLHPRWDRKSEKICFDSVWEGKRGLYITDINSKTSSSKANKITCTNDNKKIKIVYLITSCKKSGPIQVLINIIKNLNFEKFEPILITLYNETEGSCLDEITPYISKHYFIETSKIKLLTGRYKELKNILNDISPDIIHSTGVFPDYVTSKIGKYKHFMILHNYMYEDFIVKFGKIKGKILARLQLFAICKASKVVTCSKSLSEIYKEKLNLIFDYIQNGIDTSIYKVANIEEKKEMRNKLKIDQKAKICIYTGQFIHRKNIEFLLKCFLQKYKNNNDVLLILLGDGVLLDALKEQYKNESNIRFYGNVKNVNNYLSSSDIYISSSRSEGLPNGVLEAMACGVPVLLSNIPQHKEIFMYNEEIGYIFKNDDYDDFSSKLDSILFNKDLVKLSTNSRLVAETHFDGKIMSIKYQNEYINLIKVNK